MSHSIVLRRARRRPRTAVAMPLLSLVLLVCAWSVFWLFERQQASAGLDRFIAGEAARGRHWTCPDRTIDGYPFTIAVSCREVGFEGAVGGSAGRGTLAGLKTRVWLVKPTAVYVILDGPMSLSTADHRADFTLGWERFGAKVRDLLGDQVRVEIVGQGLQLSRPGIGSGTARRIEVHAGPATAPGAKKTDKVDITLKGVALPDLDALTGEAAPLDGSFSGVITQALGNLPDLDATTLKRWIDSGGQLDISDLKLAKGPLSAAAAGRLGLDEQHRLAGKLAASLAGFAPLAKRYGIPLGAVEVGGLLTHLLGGKTGSPQTASAPGTVDLPITFMDGAVTIGPFRMPGTLRPLY